jgi:copper chaperone CopZ
MAVHHLKIDGMTCGGCSGRVTRVLESIDGVSEATIDHHTGTGSVSCTDTVSMDTVVAAVEGAGFACAPA